MPAEKREYMQWIRQVRGSMTQEAFRQKVYHFSNDGKRCGVYSRNAIVKWENGKSLPNIRNTETFLSIALLEYDAENPGKPEKQTRNKRYQAVRKKMVGMLGIDLYCRNLRDALLVQVCRGVLTFEEVLPLEQKLQPVIQNAGCSMTKREKSQRTINNETQVIENDWYRVENKDALLELVEKHKFSFAVCEQTMGDRLKNLYRSRNRFGQEIGLANAIAIYAPNYQNTAERRFLHSAGTSREWLIDLCIHLRFRREEIQKALEYAHMAVLSDDEDDIESRLKEENDCPIGSAAWFCQKDREYIPAAADVISENEDLLFSLPHFCKMRNWSVNKKMKVLFLIGYGMKDFMPDNIPPIDYILESFTYYSKYRGDPLEQSLDKLMEEREPDDESCPELPDDVVTAWTGYLLSGEEAAERNGVQKIYEQYRQEFAAYYSIPSDRMLYVQHREAAHQCHFLACIFYTVFTGKYYRGKLEAEDLNVVRRQMQGLSATERYIYSFVEHIFANFLSERDIYEDRNGNFYTKNKEGKNIKSMNYRKILEETAEAVRCTL